MTSKRSQKDLDGDAGALSPVLEADSVLEKQRADCLGCTVAFTSDYTTMEMFQQMMPQTPAHEVIPTGMKTKSEEFTVVRTKLDYVRQFSTSSTSDCQQMSTIF